MFKTSLHCSTKKGWLAILGSALGNFPSSLFLRALSEMHCVQVARNSKRYWWKSVPIFLILCCIVKRAPFFGNRLAWPPKFAEVWSEPAARTVGDTEENWILWFTYENYFQRYLYHVLCLCKSHFRAYYFINHFWTAGSVQCAKKRIINYLIRDIYNSAAYIQNMKWLTSKFPSSKQPLWMISFSVRCPKTSSEEKVVIAWKLISNRNLKCSFKFLWLIGPGMCLTF